MEEINFWHDIQPTISTIIGGFISYRIARMTIFPTELTKNYQMFFL